MFFKKLYDYYIAYALQKLDGTLLIGKYTITDSEERYNFFCIEQVVMVEEVIKDVLEKQNITDIDKVILLDYKEFKKWKFQKKT